MYLSPFLLTWGRFFGVEFSDTQVNGALLFLHKCHEKILDNIVQASIRRAESITVASSPFSAKGRYFRERKATLISAGPELTASGLGG